MARRWEHTPEELKNIAIQAGYDIMQERGFQAFSARAVAAKMGYTVGTLYHLFGDLDTFILHINARTLDEWYELEVSAVPKKPELRARFFAHSYLIYARENYNRWSALFEHRLPDGVKVPEWYLPKMMRMFALIGESVLPHVDGDAKKAERLAKVLWASVHGICTLSLAGKLDQVGAGTPEKMIDDLIALAVGGKK
ncbi:MAG: TetR/AcrR family transcriptional regulator [Alphaproteobacteria bacterium]